MTYETVTYAVERGVGVLTLNRPDALNAMNGRMVEEIIDVQKRVAEDDAVNAMLVQGAARALDVSDRLGSIELGKDADLLVLDGDPLSSTTRVQYVISGGEVVVEP